MLTNSRITRSGLMIGPFCERPTDPDRRDDPDVEKTILVMMRVQRRTIREGVGEKP